jgi:Zinc finger, C3HC4 type (RING finger)
MIEKCVFCHTADATVQSATCRHFVFCQPCTNKNLGARLGFTQVRCSVCQAQISTVKVPSGGVAMPLVVVLSFMMSFRPGSGNEPNEGQLGVYFGMARDLLNRLIPRITAVSAASGTAQPADVLARLVSYSSKMAARQRLTEAEMQDLGAAFNTCCLQEEELAARRLAPAQQ